MTEIPEHLLKRAQARRAALSGSEAPAADAPADAPPAASAGTPDAPVAAAAPKAPAPLPTLDDEPAKVAPDIPVVAAAKRRKRVPYWAASVLALLPVWGILYRDATIPPPVSETDPMVIGASVFTGSGGCSGCHGADGAGTSAGAQLSEGHTFETFNDPLQMVNWLAFGYGGASRDDGSYGVDTRREKVQGSMPGFADSLTPREIAAITIYVRSNFSPDQYDPTAEQGFTAENFEADPAAFEAMVEEVIAAGGGPEPDLSAIERPAE